MNLYKTIETIGEYATKVGGAVITLCGMGILITNAFTSFFGIGIGALVALLGAMIITNNK